MIMMRAIGEAANPTTAAGAKYRVDTAWATQMWDIERGRRAEQAWRADPEAARGRAMMALGSGGVSVDVRGAAQVDRTLPVDVSLAPGLQATLDAVRSFVFSVPMAPTGRSTQMLPRSGARTACRGTCDDPGPDARQLDRGRRGDRWAIRREPSI